MSAMHPTFQIRSPFDLAVLAENGLRRGFTTGTCATAATKAALTLLHAGVLPDLVQVSLPDGVHYLTVPVTPMEQFEGWSSAAVIKDAGDDPDQTHRARIIARVRRNTSGQIKFLKGEGVGVVTQPGLRIPIGEPAINAVPRAMIRQAVSEVLETDAPDVGLDVEIGCEHGEAIALRTFNPRLGILGGISILGTTGVVEPKSLASFKASIEVYIRVALADSPSQIVLSPGNLGQRFARASLDLPLKQIVQMSNFVGFALDSVCDTLREAGVTLPLLWVVGHPGKLAKIIDGAWDTHSHRSACAVSALMTIALSKHPSFVPELSDANSCELVIERLAQHPDAPAFWTAVEDAIENILVARLERVDAVRVRLFSMSGTPLGGTR